MRLIQNLNDCTNYKFKISIKKVNKQSDKGEIMHPSCKIYSGEYIYNGNGDRT